MAEAAQKNQSGEKEFTFPSPCVYCGPSVRGVSQQFTVYTGMIPKPLVDFVREYPAARGLIVPTGRFAKTRERLMTTGTAESMLFQRVKSEVQGGNDHDV